MIEKGIVFISIWCAVLLPTLRPLSADEDHLPELSNIQEKITYGELGITEILLKNGMKIALKPTTFDEDEVFIQFIAPGGYATLDKYSRSSGHVAASAALESGLGGYTFDQLTSLEYRNLVDVVPQIDRFYRTINGSCSPEGLKTALTIVKFIFEKNSISRDALLQVVEKEKNNFKFSHKEGLPTLNELYYVFNSQNFRGFRPILDLDLRNVDYKLAESIYKSSFSQPREFVAVIVGNFELEKTIQMIDQTLGSLANGERGEWSNGFVAPKFPAGVSRKEMVSTRSGFEDASTWITIPLTKVEGLDEQRFTVLQMATKILELRLRKVSAFIGSDTHCVDVFYDMPMFPYLNPIWINVRFRSPRECVPAIEKAFITEILRLRKEGPTAEEMAAVCKQQKEVDTFWKRQNNCWQSRLINFYVWGWDPKAIFQKYEEIQGLDNNTLKAIFNDYFSLDDYSIIQAYPK